VRREREGGVKEKGGNRERRRGKEAAARVG
jgi:hypothetical protein